jgi:uncharacterized protein YhaN
VRISRLRLGAFRRFEMLDLEFAPGLNLVRGPNESGKSTIVGAILAALFEKPGATSAAARSLRRWGSPDAPRIELEFTQDGERFLLVKDFAARKAVLEPLDGGPRLDTQKAIENRVQELVGFPDAASYRRTACVTHDQMVTLAEDGRGAQMLAGMLREVVVGGLESELVDRAIKALSGQVEELGRGLDHPAKNPGVLRCLAAEKSELERRREELSSRTEDLQSNRERLAEVEGLLESRVPKLEDLRSLQDKNLARAALARRRAEVAGTFKRADDFMSMRSDLEILEREIDTDYANLSGLDPSAQEELSGRRESIRSLGDLRTRLKEQLSGVSTSGAPGSPRVVGWILAFAGVLLVALGIFLGTIHPALYAVIAPGVALAATGAYVLLRRTPLRGQELERVLAEQLADTESEISSLEARERRTLDALGFRDIDSFTGALASYRSLLASRDKARAALEALSGGKAPERVEEERNEAMLEVAQIDARLRELEPFVLEPERAEAVSREVASLEKEVKELTSEREGVSFYLSRAVSEPEELLSVEEGLARVMDEELRETRRLRIYSIALDAMRRARESMLSSAVPVLAESVGKTISSLTAGRYDTVRVDETDLAISVYSAEKGEMVPAAEVVSTLSKGTVGQLYLAARLRLVDLLSGGAMPPLIFDDSFSYFDEGRLGLLWGMLLERARDQQVLLLTCTRRYDHLLGPDVSLIELPGPGA